MGTTGAGSGTRKLRLSAAIEGHMWIATNPIARSLPPPTGRCNGTGQILGEGVQRTKGEGGVLGERTGGHRDVRCQDSPALQKPHAATQKTRGLRQRMIDDPLTALCWIPSPLLRF